MHNPFRYFNNSPEVIRLAVMMYIRYPLSLRQVEDLLFERGIDICHETVRFWWNRFGPMFAAEIRKRRIHHRSFSQWRWHLDEVFVRINGETHYLWRAVDHEGEVLDILAQARRNKKAALKLMRKLLKKQGFAPTTVTIDKLRTYGAAFRDLDLTGHHETGRYKNNRSENSHQPVRRRERKMQGFKSPGSAQRFLAIHSVVYNLFNTQRHLISRKTNRQFRDEAHDQWRNVSLAA